MAPNMAPETLGMPPFAPTIALPQTDKPKFEGAAVIPEGIVNSACSRGNNNNNSNQIISAANPNSKGDVEDGQPKARTHRRAHTWR